MRIPYSFSQCLLVKVAIISVTQEEATTYIVHIFFCYSQSSNSMLQNCVVEETSLNNRDTRMFLKLRSSIVLRFVISF